ncbi:hypothetical protein C2S51_009437 [Perilla frutescens var. frutescens]|nr:hypothetical protein C2S51_009437 [Perilla frutescens var. frutescens]
MAVNRVTSKFIVIGSKTLFNNAWFCRGFVSATAPYHEAKIDKETCGKIIETAETMIDGAKEVERVGEAITEEVIKATGQMVADAANKGLEKASQRADGKKSKDMLDTGKAAAEAVKEKFDK